MKLELYTDRLYLRPNCKDDKDFAVEILTDPVVTKYVFVGWTEEDVLNNFPLSLKRAGDGCIGIWIILDKETKEQLGSVFLLPLPIDEDDTNWDLMDNGPHIPKGEIEIGYVLKPSAWGKGFATEAVERLLKFAFEETPLQEIAATFDDPNVASRHVLLKSGLKDLGRRYCYAEDDCPDFRITRTEWLEDQAGNR